MGVDFESEAIETGIPIEIVKEIFSAQLAKDISEAKAKREADAKKAKLDAMKNMARPEADLPLTQPADPNGPSVLNDSTATQPAGVEDSANGEAAIAGSAESAMAIQNLAGQIQGNVDVTSAPDQNALVIEATEEDFLIIQQLMMMLESSRPEPEVKVFTLKNTQAEDLSANLNRLFQNWPQPQGYPKISISPETTTNSIIVSASPDTLKQISEVVKQLDSVEKTQQMDFRTYSLKNAKASVVTPQLQTILNQILTARGIRRSPFSITADDRTNTIIVTAPEGYFEQIGKLIEKLDAIPEFSTVEFAIVRLKQADAGELSGILGDLISPKNASVAGLLNRLEFNFDGDGEKMTLDLEKPIHYIADKPSQSILLLSTPENIVVMKRIVKMLDAVPMANDLIVRIFHLQFADASQLKKNLDDIFSKAGSLTQVPGTAHKLGVPENTTGKALAYEVLCAVNEFSNTLVVAGHEESLALVEVLVRQMDQKEFLTLYPVSVIGLHSANAEDVAKIIKSVMDDRVSRANDVGGGKASNRSKVVIEGDPRTNMLIVNAGADELAIIKDIVRKLDVKSTSQSVIEVIRLEFVVAEDMADMIEKFYKAKFNYKAPLTQTQPSASAVPVIIAAERSNSVIVSASETEVAEVRKLVQGLDQAKITKKMQISVIPILSANAKELAEAIMNVLNPKGDNGLKQAVILEFIRETPEGKLLLHQAVKDQVFIYGDEVSNLMVIMAPADLVGIVEALAKSIDQVAPKVEIRVIALENADADQMKDIVDELFGPKKSSEDTFGKIGEGSSVSKVEQGTFVVTSDTRTNSVILTGT